MSTLAKVMRGCSWSCSFSCGCEERAKEQKEVGGTYACLPAATKQESPSLEERQKQKMTEWVDIPSHAGNWGNSQKPTITTLQLKGRYPIGFAQNIIRLFPNLKKIVCEDPEGISLQDWVDIFAFQGIEKMEIDAKGSDMEHILSHPEINPKIKRFTLKNSRVGNETLKAFLPKCSQLTVLTLVECTRINISVCDKLLGLKKISFDRCPGVTPLDVCLYLFGVEALGTSQSSSDPIPDISATQEGIDLDKYAKPAKALHPIFQHAFPNEKKVENLKAVARTLGFSEELLANKEVLFSRLQGYANSTQWMLYFMKHGDLQMHSLNFEERLEHLSRVIRSTPSLKQGMEDQTESQRISFLIQDNVRLIQLFRALQEREDPKKPHADFGECLNHLEKAYSLFREVSGLEEGFFATSEIPDWVSNLLRVNPSQDIKV